MFALIRAHHGGRRFKLSGCQDVHPQENNGGLWEEKAECAEDNLIKAFESFQR